MVLFPSERQAVSSCMPDRDVVEPAQLRFHEKDLYAGSHIVRVFPHHPGHHMPRLCREREVLPPRMDSYPDDTSQPVS